MKINIDKKAVGQRIKNIRLDRGLTLEEFGKIFLANRSNVQSWENGTALPNKERLKQLCKLFDITRNEMLYGSIDEIIKNNKELICSGLNCSIFDLFALVNDKDISFNEININSNSVLEDIINYLKKSIEELKKDYLTKINKLLKYEDLQLYLDTFFLPQTLGNEKFKQIETVEDLKTFYNSYIDNLSIIDINDNILDLLKFHKSILENQKEKVLELFNIYVEQKNIVREIQKVLKSNIENEYIKKLIQNKINELIKNNELSIEILKNNKDLKNQLEELEKQNKDI